MCASPDAGPLMLPQKIVTCALTVDAITQTVNCRLAPRHVRISAPHHILSLSCNAPLIFHPQNMVGVSSSFHVHGIRTNPYSRSSTIEATMNYGKKFLFSAVR